MRAFIADNDWLTVFQLPAYAPDLNPVEGVWSLQRSGLLANTIFIDSDHLITSVRRALRRIQYRSHLMTGCFTETGLARSRAAPS